MGKKSFSFFKENKTLRHAEAKCKQALMKAYAVDLYEYI